MKTLISPVSQSPCSSSNSSCHSTISSVSSAVITATSSPTRRCEGLDLLVKAIYHVDEGSVIGVPYIQRRIIRRRKPAIRFANPIGITSIDVDEVNQMETISKGVDLNLNLKYQDSVLKPKRRRRSSKG